METNKHPRDTYISVYGRKPVLEVLQMDDIQIDKVLLVKNAKGELINEILQSCRRLGIDPERTTAEQVSRISKNPNQDQGIVADVVVPLMDDWGAFLEKHKNNKQAQGIVALDGVTTPANVGLIIRTCTGLGMDGILLPRKGTSSLNSLVIKASAGVIFRSQILKCEQLHKGIELAKQHGYKIYGLGVEHGARDMFRLAQFAPKSIFVMGNESLGVSEAVARLIDEWLEIPMFNGVESLNVACATSVVAAEWKRRNYTK